MATNNILPSFFLCVLYRIRPEWRKSSWPLTSLVINAVCIIAGYFLMVGIARDNYPLRTLSIGGLTLFAFSLHLLIRNTLRDPFHPDILLTIGHLIQFVIPCMIFATGSFNDIAKIESSHIYQVRFFLPEALFAVLVGQLMFNISFCIYPPCRIRAIEQPAKWTVFIILLSIAAWTSRLFMILTDSYFHSRHSNFMFKSVFYSPMAIFSTMGRIVTAYMAIRIFKSKGIWKEKIAKIYLVIEIAWFLFSGVREGLLITILCIIFGYIIVNRKIPLLYSLIFLLILFAGSSFLHYYRTAMITQPASKKAPIITASKQAIERQKKLGLKMSFFTVVDRLNDAQYTAGCLKLVPESTPFLHGKTYKMIYWIPVPRLLYPTRPKFIVNYLSLANPEITSGSAPVTAIGEAYLNFGWFGIPIVFFLLGLVYRGMDSVFKSRISYNQAAILIFFSTLVVRMTVDPAVTHFSWMLKIVVLLIACRVLERLSCFWHKPSARIGR